MLESSCWRACQREKTGIIQGICPAFLIFFPVHIVPPVVFSVVSLNLSLFKLV